MFNRILLVSTALTSAVVNATTYATFYSDSDCTENASVDFSVNDAGCFSVGSNEYVKYHGANAQCFSLVKSPSPSCPCQFDCITGFNSIGSTIDTCGFTIIPDNKCYHIGQSESLRFIGGSCGTSNCPDRSSRSIPALKDYSEDIEEVVEDEEEPTSEEAEEGLTNESAAELVNTYGNATSPSLYRRDYGKPGAGYFRCIAGDGFKSIQFFDSVLSETNLRLVHTPHGECSCQDDCWHVVGNECMVLPKAQQGAGSYRMTTEHSCASNNC
ncbi:hypothetical protein E3Q18_02952 [Wallemia mellicola]|uniref:Uncharacterized protein n=1 Tax=Wallemia mellicola TaxID=1708541 RepID=A0A4T0SP69_9BASI|nr:hypothetical protein E3Q18_02952 [Wallemia mellicola]TIC10598.1 hypothetical protein E3Q15_02983 [Wallemia mellicola]TIC28891.1 hypothetical protein E3Q10_02929 [Wallemia mellicola]TIC52751.1 hypothetical protein E3Q05_02608 [Wallemia mellicola]